MIFQQLRNYTGCTGHRTPTHTHTHVYLHTYTHKHLAAHCRKFNADVCILIIFYSIRAYVFTCVCLCLYFNTAHNFVRSMFLLLWKTPAPDWARTGLGSGIGIVCSLLPSSHKQPQRAAAADMTPAAAACACSFFYVAKCRTLLTALHRFSKFSCFKSFLLNLFHNFHKQFMLLKFIFTIYVINTIYKFTGQVLALTISIFWCRCGDVFYVICIVIDLSLVFW